MKKTFLIIGVVAILALLYSRMKFQRPATIENLPVESSVESSVTHSARMLQQKPTQSLTQATSPTVTLSDDQNVQLHLN